MTPAPPPSCPRCGYDLTGVAESWADSCPLTGVCSECGLEFDWARVLCHDRFLVRWFVEHAQRGKAAWASAWKTWCRVIVPTRFFGAVRIEHEPRPGRFLLWLLFLNLPILSLAAIVHVLLVALYVVPYLPPGFASYKGIAYSNAVLEPFVMIDIATSPAGAITGWTWHPHSQDWLPVVIFVAPMVGAWPVVLFLLPTTRAIAKVRPIHLVRAFVYSLWWLVVPAAIRLCNGLFLLVAVTPSLATSFDLQDGPNRWIYFFADRTVALAWFGALAAWTAWWWYLAIVRHMRLPQARRVWALLLPISLLSTVAVPAAIFLLGEALS